MKQCKLKDAGFHGLHICKIPKEHKTFQRIMVENVKKGKQQQQQQQQQQQSNSN